MTGRVQAALSIFLSVAVAASAQTGPPGTRPSSTAPAGTTRPAATRSSTTKAVTTTARGGKGEPLSATVKAVEGVAQRLVPGTRAKWIALKVGDELEERTVIRTGFRTRVVLDFGARGVITIRHPTKMGIAAFYQDGEVMRARLGIKYGSIRARVEKARGQSDFRVATPVSTLAITGTAGDLAYVADFGYRLLCSDGTWTCRVGQRTRHVKPTERTDSTMTRNVETVKAAAAPGMGDSFGGLTAAETKSLANHGGGRGGMGFSGAGTGAGKTVKPPKPTKPKKEGPGKRSSHLGPPKIVRPPASTLQD